MTVITVTPSKVAMVDPRDCTTMTGIAAEAITQGAACYVDVNGKIGIAGANAAGKQQFRGIALSGVGAGQPLTLCMEGMLEGFDVSNLNPWDNIFLSDTLGKLDTTFGAMYVVAAKVAVMSNPPTYSKVIYVVQNWTNYWV